MWWLVWAVVAHTANAAVFVVDKSLLTRQHSIGQPLRYAFYSGLLAGAAGVLLPWVYQPITGFIILWSVIAGVAHVLALWWFFIALKTGEPSRIVPIAGSGVPIFTLVIAVTLLGEVLTGTQLASIGVLIVGGVLLSIPLAAAQRLSASAIAAILAASAGFAIHFAAVKYLYDGSTAAFLPTFVYSRVVEALLALLLFGPWLIGRRVATRRTKKAASRGRLLAVVFLGNKVLAAGAFMLQNYAISQGSVTVVNALQGTQYVALLGLAALISYKFPQLWREELHRVALWQKISGIVLISLGLLWLV